MLIPGRHPATVDESLGSGVRTMRFQLPPSWGAAVFAHHWADFVTWQTDREEGQPPPPFGNSVLSKWLSRDPSDGRVAMAAWWLRFLGERGYYALYGRHRGSGQAVGLAVPNTMRGTVPALAGTTSKVLPVKELAMEDLAFRPIEEVPLYDTHLNLIDGREAAILEGRAFY